MDTIPTDWRRAVTAAFDDLAADGTPAALVVRRGQETVIDLAHGRDRTGQPFRSDRPVFLYSAIKPVTALAALVAVADGALDLDVPVAAVWPAFGAHGKDTVTVAEALAHGAAVPGWPAGTTATDLQDPVMAAEVLAACAPWWPPGEPGEHALTYGHVVDGILRHATGRGVVDWSREAVAATGTTLSLRPGAGEHAPAPLEDPGGTWGDRWRHAPGLMGELLRTPPELLDVEWVNGPDGRALFAPAVTGYGSAHDLAGLWAWWSGDGAAARLGRELRDRSLRPAMSGYDHVLEREVAWGLGPQLDASGYGMGGVGGCAGWVEAAPGLAIGFTSPRVLAPEQTDPLDEALAALG